MKRIITVLLSAVLLLSCAPCAVSAQGDPTISLENCSAQKGEVVRIPLYISNNPGIIALGILISYDNTCLKLLNVKDEGLFGMGINAFGNNLEAVPYTLLWEDGLSSRNHTTNGRLAVLTFEVLKAVPSNGITIETGVIDDSTFNIGLENVSFKTANCTVSVTDSPVQDETPLIQMDSTVTCSDDIVSVPIRIYNNPGIVAMRFSIRFNTKRLTLQRVENGEVFADQCAAFGKTLSSSPYNLLWEDGLTVANNNTDGILATLYFKVNSTWTAGDEVIQILLDTGSTFDAELNEVFFDTIDGIISLDSLCIHQLTDKVYVGDTFSLTASSKYGLLTYNALTWKSENERIARVDESGVVTAYRSGNVVISVTDENGDIAKRCIQVLPLGSVLQLFSFMGDFDQKVNWWKKYSTATMRLGFNTFNCEEAVRYEWSSDSSRVHIDQDGNITNTGSFSRSAEITLTAYNANGDIVAQSSVTVRFYKFNWQMRRLRTQSIVSDNFLFGAQTEEVLEVKQEESETVFSVFSFLWDWLLKRFVNI